MKHLSKLEEKTFKISSSFGYLIVDSYTGIIVECNSSRSENDYLPDLKQFDVNRFKAANNLGSIPEDVDILRFGYWSKNNVYDIPAEGYELISPDKEFFNNLYSVNDEDMK